MSKISKRTMAQAHRDANEGLEIRVMPVELIEQIDAADKALRGDSNDDEHDALFQIRKWLAQVLENGKRE